MGYIKTGKDQGAKCVLGGNAMTEKPGFFIEPTIFTECTENMTIVKEEIFGPVMSILKFSDTDEAIKMANNVQYGLIAGIFSESSKTCNYVANRVHAGQVNINNYFMMDTDVPFGGYKYSGIGREMSVAVKNFLETKAVIHDCS